MNDLGVIVFSDLLFSEHSDYVCNKSPKALGFPIHNIHDTIDINALNTLCFSLVRSIIE